MGVERAIEIMNIEIPRYVSRGFYDSGSRADFKPREEGFNFYFMGVHYLAEFYVENGKLYFLLKVKPEKKINGIEERLIEELPSNKALDRTKYLRKKRVSIDTSSVDIVCDVKKIGEEKQLYEQLWVNIIKPTMSAVYRAMSGAKNN